MFDRSKIDFGPIDPSRDALRWERMIGAVTARAVEQRRRAYSVLGQIVAWRRPTLLAAAALAVVVWSGALLGGARGGAEVEPTSTLSDWATRDQLPSAAAILELFGDHHGAK